MSNTIDKLQQAVVQYDASAAANLARISLDEKIDPIETLNALTETIRQVGDLFSKGELWLPDLVGAADTMQAAIPILQEELVRMGIDRRTLATVVIGTVSGDIHDIGKSMVSTLLIAGGFNVIDLGVDVKPETFVEAVIRTKADILAMSALLTTTAFEQKKVIEILKERKIREKVKIMVGGAAITPSFADSIGADGYEPTAPGAIDLAIKLIGKK